MKNLSEEEKKIVEESLTHAKKAGNKVFEERLKNEVGSDLAARLMAKIEELSKQNLTPDEIVEQLRRDPEVPEAGVGGAIITAGAIFAGGAIAYSQMP